MALVHLGANLVEYDFPLSIVVLTGPTAVGKSALALALAHEFPMDIVTADSRQVYRYMDIGTAKPNRHERATVLHYMLDLVRPDETYSAQRFRDEGRAVLRRIAAAGRIALVAGGTGFYVRALLEDRPLAETRPNAEIRERLYAELTELGPSALHARLASIDPVSAARVHPNNAPRLVRALEIVQQTGAPVPVTDRRDAMPALHLGLTMDRMRLHETANRRARAQLEGGLLDETEALLAMGFDPKLPALDALGYRQAVALIQGRISFDQAADAYALATRQYIRRQYTWFRRNPQTVWLDADRDPLPAAVAAIRHYLAESDHATRRLWSPAEV